MSEPLPPPAPSRGIKRSTIRTITFVLVGIHVAIFIAVIPWSPGLPPSVTGRVMLVGNTPPEKPLPLDPACSKLWAGKKPTTRFYVVGRDGGLGDVFVYLKSGLTNQTFTAPTNPVVMVKAGCLYVDYVIGAQTGQPITVRNTDPMLCNVFVQPSTPGNKMKSLALMPRKPVGTAPPRPSYLRRLWEGAVGYVRRTFNIRAPLAPTVVSEVNFTLDKPELAVRLKCDVHPWEMGYVNCVDHPFFATTDSYGKFRFPQPPPPGRYVLEAFHRKAGTQTREIEVEAGEPLKVEFELTVPK